MNTQTHDLRDAVQILEDEQVRRAMEKIAMTRVIEKAFRLDRETTGTYRYEEETAHDEMPTMKTVYIRKWALEGTPPARIKIIIDTDPTESGWSD